VVPKRSRARMMVATIACQSVGMLLAAAITLLLLKNVDSTQNWRFFLAAEGVIALLFFLLRLSEPDSPHWLMTRGRFAEAAEAFIQIMPQQREEVLQLTGNADKKSLTNAAAHLEAPGIGILFSRPYRARTVLVAVPWFLMDIATYGVGLFTPIILGAITVGSDRGGVISSDFANTRGTAAIDLFLFVGFLLGIWAVPRFGRIRMQAIGFAGMTLGMLILMSAVHLSNSGLHVPLVFAGFILFNLLMNAGPNATTFTLAPILFPTQLRGTASGFAAGFAKIGATLGVFVLPILKGKFGVPAVLGMVAAVTVLGLVVTVVFGREDEEYRSRE
jgi:putative MFS transporter